MEITSKQMNEVLKMDETEQPQKQYEIYTYCKNCLDKKGKVTIPYGTKTVEFLRSKKCYDCGCRTLVATGGISSGK